MITVNKSMRVEEEIKSEYQNEQRKLLTIERFANDSICASYELSRLIEKYIKKLAPDDDYPFAIVSHGSFGRHELSPHSDIDVMFIAPSLSQAEPILRELLSRFWDHGIEVSHTTRNFDDIRLFIEKDLHMFTQFLESRFIAGSRAVFDEWIAKVRNALDEADTVNLLDRLIADKYKRYDKFGNSPKLIEPNVKLSSGGLRDFQFIEWVYTLLNNKILVKEDDRPHVEVFIEIFRAEDFTGEKECDRLLESYKTIFTLRNLLHLIHNTKHDRLEFADQIEIAKIFDYGEEGYRTVMKKYFEAATIIARYGKTYVKKERKRFSSQMPDTLAIQLDTDFILKGEEIYYTGDEFLSMPAILRAFLYRGMNEAYFDDNLRTVIIKSLDNMTNFTDSASIGIFRQILQLPRRVGKTLNVMNELGVLGAYLPEFNDLCGFIQHGVYHCYTADEHSLKTIENVERLHNKQGDLANVFLSLRNREVLYFALLVHDIAKPFCVQGHEITGAEMGDSVMQRLGYSDAEIELARFLIENHLLMAQFAFHRNLNEPETLNNFAGKIPSLEHLNMLYVMTFGDLSAVNPALWNSWKNDLLNELYRKSKHMLIEDISGEQLLGKKKKMHPDNITKHSDTINSGDVKDHIESIDDVGYTSHFSEKEIAVHIEKIKSGEPVSVVFGEQSGFTNITVIANDSPSLLTTLCGVMLVNDVNIHDAKIFTRSDGIIIDTFNVTDFRSGEKVNPEKYLKLQEDFSLSIGGLLELEPAIKRMKSKWWRIEKKLFSKQGSISVTFEELDKYTIIDVQSPDRIGLLYYVTKKLHECGLQIFFARITTNGDEALDTFYALDDDGMKVSENHYPFIRDEVQTAIQQLLKRNIS